MKINSLHKFLQKIKTKAPKILVIGDIMLDNYISGDVNRVSPEAPVSILDFKEEKKVLGGAGNVVHNLVNLGANVSLATIIGDDFDGEETKVLLNKLSLHLDIIHTSQSCNTTKKTRFISRGTQLLRLDNDSKGFKKEDHRILEKKIENSLSQFDCVIISDYAKGVCSDSLIRNVIKRINHIKLPLYVDPKGDNWSKYSSSTCLTPNINEVQNELSKKIHSDIDFENAAKTIIEKYGLKFCLITRGEQGMTYFDNEISIHQKVGEKEVYDVSGAGDTVIACLASSLSSGIGLKESIEISSIISSEVVSHSGTMPYSEDMFCDYE